MKKGMIYNCFSERLPTCPVLRHARSRLMNMGIWLQKLGPPFTWSSSCILIIFVMWSLNLAFFGDRSRHPYPYHSKFIPCQIHHFLLPLFWTQNRRRKAELAHFWVEYGPRHFWLVDNSPSYLVPDASSHRPIPSISQGSQFWRLRHFTTLAKQAIPRISNLMLGFRVSCLYIIQRSLLLVSASPSIFPIMRRHKGSYDATFSGLRSLPSLPWRLQQLGMVRNDAFERRRCRVTDRHSWISFFSLVVDAVRVRTSNISVGS